MEAVCVLVEDKASGRSLIQELKQGTRFPILAIKVDPARFGLRRFAKSLLLFLRMSLLTFLASRS